MKKTIHQTMLRLCAVLVAALMLTVNASAQCMKFSFSGLSGVTEKYLNDGTTLVQLPAGTSLSNLSNYGMTATADGAAATLSEIVPNPGSTTFTDGALNVFYYKGKAYKVRFAAGEYFTAVFFNKAQFGGVSSLSQADLTAFAQRVTKMGTADGPNYTFDALPGYVPTTDIAFFMGDMNSTTSPAPIIHTLDTDYMNIVAKCAVVTGQFETQGTNATVTEYGLCYGTSANPTTSNTYKAAADIAESDDTFGDELVGIFGVYFDNLTQETTYHVRAYCKYTMNGTSYTTYGEDRTFTTPAPSGMTWAWEGGETPDATTKARIEEAMNGAKEYYNNYCTLYKWAGCSYNSGVATADCSLRSDASCYIRFGPVERYQWVGTAQHELSHGYGVGQTSAYAGYPSPFKFKVATLTLRVFLQDMTMLISHDSQHYWPGGINQREEVTNGTANNKGTYTCQNEEMLKCNAMILNGLAKDGMKTTYGAKSRDEFEPDEEESSFAKPRKVTGNTGFETALNAFNEAGIPLILAPGDIDLASTANSDGYTLNGNTYATITRSLTEAQGHGVSDVSRFSGTSLSNTVQPQPYAFLFKGVRFYNGMNLWFDKPMYKYSNTSYRYLTPDQILSNLTTYVGSHSSETSIWLQHIPFNADDATWLDNTTGTLYRYTNGTTTVASGTYNATYNAYNTAARRRTKLSGLISQTANAAMFSGHGDSYNDNNYNNAFHDYTVPNLNNTPCDVLIVLMKAGTGVIEVKQVDLRDYQNYAQQYEDPATEYTAGENNAILAGLVQGITTLNTGDASLNSAVQTGKNATTAAAVTSAISSINSAFTTYANAQSGDVDVSGLLGTNLDFSTAIGAQNAARAEVFKVPGWNTYMNAASSTWQFIEYKTDLGSPNGGNALYIRENWKGNPALPSTVQVYKDAVLPAGNYRLTFEMRQPSNNGTSMLNYYELNGVRTTFTAGTSWETKTIQLTISEPSTLRLSFGFVGSRTEGNLPTEVDVDNVKLFMTQRVQTTGKASMVDDGWTQITAAPNDYSPYFFAIYDHSQDLGLVQAAGVNQGTANKTMWYQSNTTPGLDKNALWTFDSNVADNTEYVVMTCANYPDYMMQTEWNAAWNFRTNDNGGGGIEWGRTLISYGDSKWTIQNGRYPDSGYLGAWNNTIEEGAEVALNKTGDAVGNFDIYSILRGQYVAKYENLSSASLDNPLNISYVLSNPGAERRSTIGWKSSGNTMGSQGNTAMSGKVGGYYFERWVASGSIGATDLYQEIQGLPEGRYRFSALAYTTGNCHIYANNEQTAMPTTNNGTRVSVIVTLAANETLRVGARATTSSSSWMTFDDAKLEFLGVPDSYFVGEPTISIADNTYIQELSTVTFNYTLATSSDGSPFALLNSTTKATLKKGSTTVAEGTLSLSGNTVTATFSGLTLDPGSDYTLTLPADAVGYAGHATNEAVTLTLHTPALFDTTCYLYNETEYKYLSRNGAWNTQAVADDYGLAVQIVTNEQGKTHLRMFDNQLYVFNDGNGTLFADGGTPLDFTAVAASGKYRFQCANGYLAVSNGTVVDNAAADATSLWTLETTADHVANYTTQANAQAATAATAASLSGVTTAAQLAGMIGTDFVTESITITGAQAEKYQQYAPTVADGTDLDYYTETIEDVRPGLYRLTVDAFQRASYNERVADADGARGLIMLFANDAQTQLKSVMEYGAATAYAGDYEYNGLHYPNNEASAYTALETGNYKNTIYVYVPADDGETTGTLTFGIRILNRMGNNVNTGTWSAYKNFQLDYLMPVITLSELSTTQPQAAANVLVNLTRSISAASSIESENAWNTICLPFALTADQVEAFGEDVVVKKLTGVDTTNGNATLSFTELASGEGIEANVPYILKTTTAGTSYTFRDVTIAPSATPVTEIGSVQFTGNYVAEHVLTTDDYYVLGDKFYKSSGKTKMKGYRAYFHIPSSSGIKSLGFDFGDPTAIVSLGTDALTQPVDVYTPSGQLVRRQATSLDGLPRGVYIIGGKKVMK